MIKKTSILIDGYNLYHAIDGLKQPRLKWVDLLKLSREFARRDHGFEIIRIIFFTAPPIHKSLSVQQKYRHYISALKWHCGVKIIEGKFKKKVMSYTDSQQNILRRVTYEEKESDVNLALAILEDAVEKISDKILVITNDSDIAPAIRMAREKNRDVKINVITPPLVKNRRANYDLIHACGEIKKNKKGQVFFKTRMISQGHLRKCLMPEEIVIEGGKKIVMPWDYDGEK